VAIALDEEPPAGGGAAVTAPWQGEERHDGGEDENAAQVRSVPLCELRDHGRKGEERDPARARRERVRVVEAVRLELRVHRSPSGRADGGALPVGEAQQVDVAPEHEDGDPALQVLEAERRQPAAVRVVAGRVAARPRGGGGGGGRGRARGAGGPRGGRAPGRDGGGQRPAGAGGPRRAGRAGRERARRARYARRARDGDGAVGLGEGDNRVRGRRAPRG